MALAFAAPVLMAAAGYSLLYLLMGGGLGGAILIFIVAKMLGKLESVPGAKVAYCSSRLVSTTGRLGAIKFHAEVALAPFETFARYWGWQIGAKYGQAFLASSPLKVSDPSLLVQDVVPRP